MLYENTYGRLPGYHMVVPSATDPNAAHVGWPVMLLPSMDHMEVWQVWSLGLGGLNSATGNTTNVGNPNYPPIVKLLELHLSERSARLGQVRLGRPVLVHRQ